MNKIITGLFIFYFIYLFILPHHKYIENNKRKIERMDLTIARRPKGNYEAYIKWASSVIVLQDEIKKEDKNMTTDTITISYNRNVKWKDTRKKSYRKVNT